MPNPNAVVSTVIRFEPKLERPPAEQLRVEGGLSVELEGGRRARLSPEDPRSVGFAQVLAGLSIQGLPVYVELEPETSSIARMFIPHVSRVTAIEPGDDDSLHVELELSHARHVLRRGSTDFELLETQPRDAAETKASVMVTEDDAHEIIDVRAYTPDPEGPRLPLPERSEPLRKPRGARIADRLAIFWRWRCWPWWLCIWPWRRRRCVSRARAQEVFDAMSATTCDPQTVPPPCIPFLYPDDGCWARAHEMCRLIIDMGLSPRKVWIQGSLHVSTRNNPNCAVNWGWHVAPTLCVCGSWGCREDMVIDPSLFTTPVTKDTWKGVQGDPTATLTDSDASDYLWGETDPTYVKTNDRLAYYRLQLQLRSVQQGPPPYANCP